MITNIRLSREPGRIIIERVSLACPEWSSLPLRVRSVDMSARSIPPNTLECSWAAFKSVLPYIVKVSDVTLDDNVKKVINRHLLAKPLSLTDNSLTESLRRAKFTGRVLTKEQRRDLLSLAHMAHGANFSVPGAGKTTVSMALHFLWSHERGADSRLLVIAPKNAFVAWDETLSACSSNKNSRFIRLTTQNITAELESNPRYAITNYEVISAIVAPLALWLDSHDTHVILDESHRIKSPTSSRGAAAHSLAHLAARRDILSGTPAPQEPGDLDNQVRFLYPGNYQSGIKSSADLRGIYVRTTKNELNLPPRISKTIKVEPHPLEASLYSLLASDVALALSGLNFNDREAVRSISSKVITLIRSTVDPALVAKRLPLGPRESEVRQLVHCLNSDKFIPSKLQKAALIATRRAKSGKKTVVWSSFPNTIEKLVSITQDLNPLSLHGGIPTGEDDNPYTREGRLKIFHEDPYSFLLVANPSACGEGISLHRASQSAIYMDRSYNAAHYLQSVDRIHRLGMPEDAVTKISILQWRTPNGIGSIDLAVDRRLSYKISKLSEILEDPELAIGTDPYLATVEEWDIESESTLLDKGDLIDLRNEFIGKKHV